MSAISFKKWRIGVYVAIGCSLLTACAGLTAGMSWRAFLAVFSTACLTNFGNWLVKHPVEEIETTITKKEE